MASNYAINLQAKLDTSSVQAELKKLREMQQQMGQGGNGQGNSAAQVNVGNIDRTLLKLNSTLTQLQKTIQQMPNKVGQKVGTNLANASSVYNPNPTRVIAPTRTNARGYMPANWRQLDPDVKEMYAMEWFKTQRNYQTLDQWRGNHRYRRLPNMTDDQSALIAYQNYQIDQWERANVRAERKKSTTRARMMRRAGGLMVGYAIDPIAEGLEEYGYSKTAAVVGGFGAGVKEGFGTGLSLQMMGVPTKFAVAAGVASGMWTAGTRIYKGLEQVADNIEQYNSRLTRAVQQMGDQSHDQAMGRRMFKTEYDASQATLNKDFKTAQKNREKYEEDYRRDREHFLKMDDPRNVTARILYQAQMEKGRLKDDDLKGKQQIDVKAADAVAAYQREFNRAKTNMDQSRASYEAWKGVEDGIKQERNAWSQAVIRRRESVRVNTEQYATRMRYQDQVNSTEAFSLGILRNRTMAPQEQFNQIGGELDTLRKERNDILKQAFDLNKKIQGAGTNLSPARLENMVKERDQAMAQAGVVGHRISVLENALTQIRDNSTAPDFSHMTSLGQYGFNMGERERTNSLMETYYSKMTNITQQIRDKLDEGITTQAVYGE